MHIWHHAVTGQGLAAVAQPLVGSLFNRIGEHATHAQWCCMNSIWAAGIPDCGLVAQWHATSAISADVVVRLADEGALQEMRRADNLVDVTGDVVLKGQVQQGLGFTFATPAIMLMPGLAVAKTGQEPTHIGCTCQQLARQHVMPLVESQHGCCSAAGSARSGRGLPGRRQGTGGQRQARQRPAVSAAQEQGQWQEAGLCRQQTVTVWLLGPGGPGGMFGC